MPSDLLLSFYYGKDIRVASHCEGSRRERVRKYTRQKRLVKLLRN